MDNLGCSTAKPRQVAVKQTLQTSAVGPNPNIWLRHPSVCYWPIADSGFVCFRQAYSIKE